MMALVEEFMLTIKKKAAEKIGMISEIVHLKDTLKKKYNELNNLNNDDSVSGILVQVPLPKQVSEQKILKQSILKKMWTDFIQ